MKPRELATPFAVLLLAGCAATHENRAAPSAESQQSASHAGPDFGNFSVSLSVKDIAASRAFYEKLGFRPVGGDERQKWLIMQNRTSTIGLFQGMFERNMLTFNPGWDRDSRALT